MMSPVNKFLERVTKQDLMKDNMPVNGLVFQVLSVPGSSSTIQLIAKCLVKVKENAECQEFHYTQIYDVNSPFPKDFFEIACVTIAGDIAKTVGVEHIQRTVKLTKVSTGVNIAHVFVTSGLKVVAKAT